ncbi:T9SS type A sorting domain-containing protein [Flavobacterium sedimenticola]|uniref:T9SS type A sorting domain-containing protein n=1 Tax=Flavobacterium sedimenticola TaxID=3043286 RepID=A0ABT6XS08_9FLAO|nr:T9SS type A sorting domain-containing protein [Flavobacterium sedimenticola]MDI9257878.1 T9SS type A sorting domain-containing protein [Flavobacterium sedimenticola]
MKKTLLPIIALITLSCSAQNIFHDDFSNYTSNIQLSGQGVWTNNSSLPGGLGNCVGALCQNAKVVDQNISATAYGSSTKAFSLTPNTDGCGRAFTSFTSNGNLYIGMVINITNAQSSPIDFFRVLSGNNFNTTFRVLVQPTSGSTYSIGIRKGDTSNPTVYTNESYNYGTDYLLIFKYTQASGTNDDTISLYANANFAAGESGNIVSATNFAGNDQSGNIDRMSFRQNAGPSGMPTGKVSLVSVSTTWESLAFSLSNNDFNKNTFTVVGNQLTNGILNIKSDGIVENVTLTIYDLQGRKMVSKFISLQDTVNDIAVTPLRNTGVYVVELTSENNQRFTQKILVK